MPLAADGSRAVGFTGSRVGGKGRRRRTTVPQDGTYRLNGLVTGPRGRAQLFLIEDLATASVRRAEVELKPGEVTRHDFGRATVASEVAIIEGRVTAGGAPLSDLLVMARDPGNDEDRAMARTDDNGRYRIEGLEPGPRKMLVILGDYRIVDDFGARQLEPVTMEAGEVRTFDFELPGGVVEVVLLDAETGKPISGAVTMAQPEDKAHGGDLIEGFRTRLGWGAHCDKDGSTRLYALPTDAPLVVRYRAPGYAAGERSGVVAGRAEEPTRVEIKLTRKP